MKITAKGKLAYIKLEDRNTGEHYIIIGLSGEASKARKQKGTAVVTVCNFVTVIEKMC